MPKSTLSSDLQAIEIAVHNAPHGLTARQIADGLPNAVPMRTLQYRLRRLVEDGRLAAKGSRRSRRYHIRSSGEDEAGADRPLQLSDRGRSLIAILEKPREQRTPAGYDIGFLNAYRPNSSAYLSAAELTHLEKIGRPGAGALPAGTYAKRILQRLLIDLSWNSSRLEGNTYTLLDTEHLLKRGKAAEGRDLMETQMIVNHKDAITFLVDNAEEIGFDRRTICSLHAILATNLLSDISARGRLRRIPISIGGSVFHPLEMPQLIEQCFDEILRKAAAIENPFEQSFFLMVHLPYLQAFDDVNKRLSRLAANIPYIKRNLSPLSFTDVPRETYLQAVLAVYELRDVSLLQEIFVWAYERSAKHYAAARQSLTSPDFFRMQHGEALRRFVAHTVRSRVPKDKARLFIDNWMEANIDSEQHEQFRRAAEVDLFALHEANFWAYGVTPSEFETWRKTWRGNGENPR